MHDYVIGMYKEELDTPVLLVNVEVMEQNITKMAGFFRSHSVGWRPHSKCHKIPAIAHKQLKTGAIGITCAKVGEAEVMAANGIRDILIANQIVGSQKISRLMALQRWADVMVSVDNAGNVEALGRAAQAHGVEVRVLVEVNIGMNRVGVEPGEQALDLARRVAETKGLYFAGLMGYEGHVITIVDLEQKQQEAKAALECLIRTKRLIEETGLPVGIVSAGGTGDYTIAGAYPGVTEIQAGGGIFMDMMYSEQCGVTGLDYALTVLATVTSRARPGQVVVDAGFKTMSECHETPRVKDRPGLKVVYLSAEHGVLELEEGSEGPAVGEKVEFIVGYCDSTVFLHDYLYGIRDGRVEVVWEIAGRGRIR